MLFLFFLLYHIQKLSTTSAVSLSEHEELELVVSSEHTSTSDGTEDVGTCNKRLDMDKRQKKGGGEERIHTSSLEEGFGSLLLYDLTEGMNGGLVLDGLTRSHHHTLRSSKYI
jgi:hypothetical protein